MTKNISRFVFCLLFLVFYLAPAANAQYDTSYVQNIDHYIAMTDSLAQSRRLTTGTSDGSITTATMKIVYDSAKSKNDTTWIPNVIGKFSLEYIYRNDSVFKIIYRDNTDKNIVETFYFRNKQPVYAKIRLEERADSVLYQGTEYYKNNKIVYTASPPVQAPKEYKNRILFSWLDAGKKYYIQITTGSR